MTQTALKNKEIETRRDQQKADRDLKREEFKHQQKMDFLGLGAKIAGFFKPVSKGSNIVRSAGRRNDPAFYKNYINDLDKFTNLPTWNRLGYDTFEGQLRGADSVDASTGVVTPGLRGAAPGIAVLHWVPSIGSASSGAADLSTTPMNQILMRTKEQVLKSNSRSNVPYEASDLGMNFLASGMIMLAIAEFERAILVAQTYKANNAYYNSVYLEALGVRFDLTKDLPKARQYLTLLKNRFNRAIVAPAKLSYFARMAYMGSLWVKDTEVKPAAVYSATADVMWLLSDDGSYLDVIANPVHAASLDLVYTNISLMIQRLVENADFVSMFADLRSAFGDNLLQMETTISGDSEIEENFDAMAIEQIANVYTLPVVTSDDINFTSVDYETVRVRQDSSGFLYQGSAAATQGILCKIDISEWPDPYVAKVNSILDKSHVLNFHKDNINGDDILDVTRWHFTTTGYARIGAAESTEYGFRVLSCDVCVAVGWTVFSINRVANSVTTTSIKTGSKYIIVDAFGKYELNNLLCASSAFDWMPLITVADLSETTLVKYRTHGDIQHLVAYPIANIESLNMACVLGEMFINADQFKH